MMIAIVHACSKAHARAEAKTEVKTPGCMIDGEWHESNSDTWVESASTDAGEVTMRVDVPRGPRGAEVGHASRRGR